MSANPLISAIRHHRISPDRDQRYNSGQNRPVAFAGRLGQDPRLGHTNEGVPVANFSVAYNPRVRSGDQWVDGDTVWYSVAAFRDLGVHAIDSLRKGDHVMVIGKQTDVEYKRKDESIGVDHQVVADFLGPALNFATAEIHRVERSVAPSATVSDIGVAG
jgi:single stranded DNA-binding protein